MLKDHLVFNGYRLVNTIEKSYDKNDLNYFLQKIKLENYRQLGDLIQAQKALRLVLTTKIGGSMSSGFLQRF